MLKKKNKESQIKPFLKGFAPKRLHTAIAVIIFFACLIIEGVALLEALNGNIFSASIYHLVASLVTPWLLCFFMPKHLETKYSLLALLFLFCFFIPLFSGIGLFFSLILPLYFTKKPEINEFEYADPLSAEEIISHSTSKPDYCNGRIFGVLRFAKDKEKRIKAVLSTNQIADEIAIPMLRIALLDSIDEVRLLAYSILNDKEKSIDSIIHQGLDQLESRNLSLKAKSAIHHKLADAYWELSYLGLVKGRARDHTLNSAKLHAEKAIKTKSNNIGLLLLYVQILTSLGYFKEANNLLKKIQKRGISTEKLAARSAELAFELKRFSEVGKHVKKLDRLADNNMIIDGMLKQWG